MIPPCSCSPPTCCAPARHTPTVARCRVTGEARHSINRAVGVNRIGATAPPGTEAPWRMVARSPASPLPSMHGGPERDERYRSLRCDHRRGARLRRRRPQRRRRHAARHARAPRPLHRRYRPLPVRRPAFRRGGRTHAGAWRAPHRRGLRAARRRVQHGLVGRARAAARALRRAHRRHGAAAQARDRAHAQRARRRARHRRHRRRRPSRAAPRELRGRPRGADRAHVRPRRPGRGR